jgi:hypothetical protein
MGVASHYAEVWCLHADSRTWSDKTPVSPGPKGSGVDGPMCKMLTSRQTNVIGTAIAVAGTSP